MKNFTRILALILALIALASFAACNSKGGDNPDNGTSASSESDKKDPASTGESGSSGPVFVYNGVTIEMNALADPILKALGDPKDTYEAPSCAFQGNDYYYNYGSFEVSAYEDNGERRIYSVVLKDDLVTTPEGLAIGSPEADAQRIYGDAARTDNGNFVVKTDNVTVTVIIKDGAVSSIDYVAVVPND